VSTKVGCETVDWMRLAQSKVQRRGSCKHGYEHSDSTNGGELFDWPKECNLSNNDSVP
jgi:hypothetical protein